MFPFSIYVLCVMQFNGDIVLMHGKVLLEGGARTLTVASALPA